MSESPNLNSTAVPAAQRAGLLDANDPMKFSDKALLDPPSYVRNFAHAVAGHEAQVVQQQEAAVTFTNSNQVWDAVTQLLKQAEAAGFEVDVFEDRGEKHCVRVVQSGEKRLVVQSRLTGNMNTPANPA